VDILYTQQIADGIRVRHLATAINEVWSLRPDKSDSSACREMDKRRFDQALVAQDGAVTGVVSRSDMHQFPYVNYRFPTFARTKMLGLQPRSIYEAPVSCITDAMPLAVLLSSFGFVQGLRSMARSSIHLIMTALRAPTLWCALAMGAAWYVTLSSVGLTNRYLGAWILGQLR
jgi:hypothetical protein